MIAEGRVISSTPEDKGFTDNEKEGLVDFTYRQGSQPCGRSIWSRVGSLRKCYKFSTSRQIYVVRLALNVMNRFPIYAVLKSCGPSSKRTP